MQRRAVDDDPRAVAFVGTSRMELAYSPEAFAESTPGLHGVQLAIDGMPPLGVLEDLADDEAFVGTAVVDVAEWDLSRPDAFTATKSYVARSHSLWRAPGALVNRYLAGLAQSRLALLTVGGRELIASIVGERRWPDPRWVVMARDRSFRADYSLASPPALRKRTDKAVHGLPAEGPDPEAWLAALPRIDAAVAKLRARGGKVVFVRLPVTGRLGAAVEAVYPHERYWRLFAARSTAPVIDLHDVPAIAALECPDGMHLDQRDQATFTRALVSVLRERGLLPAE